MSNPGSPPLEIDQQLEGSGACTEPVAAGDVSAGATAALANLTLGAPSPAVPSDPTMTQVMAMLANVLGRLTDQAPVPSGPRLSDKTMHRPEPLCVDLSKKAPIPPAEQVNLWIFNFETYMRHSRTPADEWGQVLMSFLKGPIKQGIKEFMGVNRKPATYDNVKAMLLRYVDGSDDLLFDLKAKANSYSLAITCADVSGQKSLLEGIADFELLLNRCNYMPEDKCFLLFNAFPSTLQHLIRFDLASGANVEWNDYGRMRTHVLTFAGPFAEHVRTAYLPQLQITPRSVPSTSRKTDRRTSPDRRQRSPERRRSPSPKRTRRFDPAVDVKQHDRSAHHLRDHTYFIKDMTISKKETLRKDGRCMLCERKGHRVIDCPEKQHYFDKGSFFYYPVSLRPAM